MDAADHRTHPRSPLPSSAAYLSAHRLLIARVGDLSAGGAFLSTRFPDPVGTRASIELNLGGEDVQLDVEVVRVSFDVRAAGMGVTFVDVPRDVRRFLVAHG